MATEENVETGGCPAPERVVRAEKTPLLTSEEVQTRLTGCHNFGLGLIGGLLKLRLAPSALYIQFGLPSCDAEQPTLSCFIFSPRGSTRGRLGGEHGQAEVARLHFCRCCRLLLHRQQRWDQVGLDQGR